MANEYSLWYAKKYGTRVGDESSAIAEDRAATRDDKGCFDDTRATYTGEALVTLLGMIKNYGAMHECWARMTKEEKQDFYDCERAASDYVSSIDKKNLCKPSDFKYRGKGRTERLNYKKKDEDKKTDKGKEKDEGGETQDSRPRGKYVYVVSCNDRDGTLFRLLKAIGRHGNCGHSYDIVLDPDSQGKGETFFWDGDGSDRIENVAKLEEGDDLAAMLLANLHQIKWMCDDAIPANKKGLKDSMEEPEAKKPVDPIATLKEIQTRCEAATDGYVRDGVYALPVSTLKTIKEWLTPKDADVDLDHVRWIVNSDIEKYEKAYKTDKWLEDNKPSLAK